jgi:hypothetical protein
MTVETASPRYTQEQHVAPSRLVDGDGGRSRFEDKIISYTSNLGPLRQTPAVPGTAISFHLCLAGYASDFRPAVRRHVILVAKGAMEVRAGSAEVRTFRPGDVLETLDCDGKGHIVRAVGNQPFGAALIELDNSTGCETEKPARRLSKQSLPSLRNITGDDGQSHFEDGALPYIAGDDGCLFTDDIGINAFQFVLSMGDLSFDFHTAPQRQIVLPLTGGIEDENGDGSRRKIRPGEVYFREDSTGKGHITRALDCPVRFSIFARLV